MKKLSVSEMKNVKGGCSFVTGTGAQQPCAKAGLCYLCEFNVNNITSQPGATNYTGAGSGGYAPPINPPYIPPGS